MATRPNLHRRLERAMHETQFAVGISFLEVLAQGEVRPAAAGRLTLWVPLNLIRLVERARDLEADRVFLLRVMRAFVSPVMVGDEASPSRVTFDHVNRLIRNLHVLVESGRLRVIEEIDERLESRLENVFPRALFGIRLSPEQNFVARYVGSVLRWSRKTGKAILEGGERLINHVGSWIGSLRIPDRTRGVLEAKEQLSAELLAEFGISKSTKKIVGIATATVGAFLAVTSPLGPAVGLLGLMITYTDP